MSSVEDQSYIIEKTFCNSIIIPSEQISFSGEIVIKYDKNGKRKKNYIEKHKVIIPKSKTIPLLLDDFFIDEVKNAL